MSVARTALASILILSMTLQMGYLSFCQSPASLNKSLEKKLSAENASVNSGVPELNSLLHNKDSLQAVLLLNQLQKTSDPSNEYFNARFSLCKAAWLSHYEPNSEAVRQLLNQALNAAFETASDSLVSFVSWEYGSMMYYATQYGLASVYCLFALETNEKTGRIMSADDYGLLGDLFFRTQEYTSSAFYTGRAIRQTHAVDHAVMSWYNTLGLCLQGLRNYDSAFFYFNIALSISKKINDAIWQSIISGNIGQIYFQQKKYSLAKPLLEADYQSSKSYGEIASAANSLQWVARINLIEGSIDSAVIQIKEVLLLLQKTSTTGYLQNAYYAAAEVYRRLGNSDSLYRYQRLYEELHDSEEKRIAEARLDIARIKLDNLKNQLVIENLSKEKKSEEFKRNAIIGGLIMLSIIAILYVNSLRVKLRYKVELAIEQRKNVETEILAAREKLELFTRNIVEKSDLIDKLRQQAREKEFDSSHQQLVEELIHQTILTEDDWEKFKKIFDKTYPGFFRKLKEKANDITVAEQRMAALTRLQLETRQIASMLGISVDSVHKSRQRLRQRLDFSLEPDLKEFLARL